MCGKHACVMKKVPRALMLVIRSYLLGGVSTMLCHQSALALLIRMSIRPNLAIVSDTHRVMLSRSLRFTLHASALTPSDLTSAATV